MRPSQWARDDPSARQRGGQIRIQVLRPQATLTYERIGAIGGNTDMTVLSLTWTSDRAAGTGPTIAGTEADASG